MYNKPPLFFFITFLLKRERDHFINFNKTLKTFIRKKKLKERISQLPFKTFLNLLNLLFIYKSRLLYFNKLKFFNTLKGHYEVFINFKL
jgi:Mn-containing catalase